MDLNIRKDVLRNLSECSYDQIRATITDAVGINDEKVLPGLGVMFEVLWQNSDEEHKNWITQSMTSFVK